MRNTLLIIVAAATAGCMRDPSPDSPDSGLWAANAAYDRALIAGDAAALANVYTGDFTIIDDDGNVHGKQDQIRTMTQVIDLVEARSDDVKVTALGSNAALLTGRFTGRYRMGGKESSFTERYTSIWVNQEGGWKVRHEHASMVPKPEATPGG